jgi:hypothetical protein
MPKLSGTDKAIKQLEDEIYVLVAAKDRLIAQRDAEKAKRKEKDLP